jgi:hypothetical protein
VVFLRCLMKTDPKRKSAANGNNYAIGEDMETTLDRAILIRSIVYLQFRLLGDAGQVECSASEMLSSEEPSVYGPGAWSNHRQRATEDRQHE